VIIEGGWAYSADGAFELEGYATICLSHFLCSRIGCRIR
jgi:hypothetical protein